MSISGTGNEGGKDSSETAKIIALHSSSLLSLLFFYNIENNGIIIKCNDRKILFNKIFFEYKNKVRSNGYPSNMDVVLISTENNTILFLESKFTEYLTLEKKLNNIGKSYLDINTSKYVYENKKFICPPLGLKVNINNNKTFNLIATNEPLYINGIKQLIAHNVGIDNFMSRNFYNDEYKALNEVKNFYNDKTKVYFGTILYKFISEEFVDIFNTYESQYKALISIFNENNKHKNLEYLNSILTYQDIDKSHLNKTIKDYYFLE